MELVVIEADMVDIHCYHGTKEKVFVQIEELASPQYQPPTSKMIKVVFLVYNMSLKQYSTIYESMKSHFGPTVLTYSINLLMVRSKEEIEETIGQMRKMNSSEFQFNYLKLQEISQRRINVDLVNSYISKKFKWNDVKMDYFLQKNQITSISKLLNYDKYPQMEKNIVGKTLDFARYCQEMKSIQQRSKDNKS